MRVEVERAVHPAFERFLHDEIQTLKMLDDITHDLAADEGGKLPADALDRQRALQECEIRRIVRPDIDVGGIALVAGARSAMSRTMRRALRCGALMRRGSRRSA